MTQTTQTPAPHRPAPLRETLTRCPDELAAFTRARDELLTILDGLDDVGPADAAANRSIRAARDRLARVEASVTFIGQVKSGKTTLVNAMIGEPDLLPADVNPWTSVVTSAHLGPPPPDASFAARFRFFDPDDWDKLTRTGGRLGELAGRSGAEDEAEKEG